MPKKKEKKLVAALSSDQYNINLLAKGQPPYPAEQQTALRNSISTDGQSLPITLWNGEILDGRGRYQACRDLGIAPKVEEIEFGSDEEALRFLRVRNGWRAHVRAEQRAASYLLDPASAERIVGLKVKAEENQRSGKKIFGSVSVDEQVAREIGVSRSSFQRVLQVLRDKVYGGTDQVRKVADGSLSCGRWQSGRRSTNRINAIYWDEVVGKQKYDVVYADPPWSYSSAANLCDAMATGSFAPEDHYATMHDRDILEVGDRLQDSLSDDSFLFLWTTNFRLGFGFEVLKAWGFKYATNIVWHKARGEDRTHTGVGLGPWVTQVHETLLVGRRGQGVPAYAGVKSHSCLKLPSREHSRKPDEFRAIIEGWFPPPHRKLELFARSSHPGWASFGDQNSKFSEKTTVDTDAKQMV